MTPKCCRLRGETSGRRVIIKLVLVLMMIIVLLSVCW